jgi:ribose 5-phosphate isomerase B
MLWVMKIYIGSDHGGFDLKQQIKEYLVKNKHTVLDLGCKSNDSCDYPEFGAAVGRAVVENPDALGIVICGSGIGISIAANKIKGVRAALADSIEMARLGREHNGANILALGERTAFLDDPLEIVETFLTTPVDMDERHKRRRGQLDSLS